MNFLVSEFIIENAKSGEFKGKKVLEVGSRYVNGSVRSFIEKWLKPKEYVGIDIEKGKFVDFVLPAEKLVDYFGSLCFDVVIATEVLEHVNDWRLVINNMKAVLKNEGYIYLTAPSKNFPYHAYPFDFWRYEVNDIRKIFSDFHIINLESCEVLPAVFFKGCKPLNCTPNNLDNIPLYSIVLGKRTRLIPLPWEMPPRRKIKIHLREQRLVRKVLPSRLITII